MPGVDTFPGSPIVVEAGIVPSRLEGTLAGLDAYRAVSGVGLTWIPCRDAAHAAEVAARAEAAVTCRAEIPEPSRRERSALEERIRLACDPGDTFAGGT